MDDDFVVEVVLADVSVPGRRRTDCSRNEALIRRFDAAAAAALVDSWTFISSNRPLSLLAVVAAAVVVVVVDTEDPTLPSFSLQLPLLLVLILLTDEPRLMDPATMLHRLMTGCWMMMNDQGLYTVRTDNVQASNFKRFVVR